MPDEIAEAIETNAQQPRRAAGDGMEAEQHPLGDQIAADRYVSGRSGVDASATMGLRFSKFKASGA